MLILVILSFFVSLIIAVVAIPSIISVAAIKNLMDEPDEHRKFHSTKTPTLGGVAIFAGTVFSFSFFNDYLSSASSIRFMTSSLILLFFAGIKDDILLLSPLKKLIVQIASAILVTLLGRLYFTNLWGMFEIYAIPSVVGIALTTLIIVALINAFNLVDGVNGLAGGLALIACLFFANWFYFTGQYSVSILSFSLAGSIVGFLIFNFPKGKIFMGDTGSMIIGFIVSLLAIKFIESNRAAGFHSSPYYFRAAPGVAVAVVIVPLLDLVRVFFSRLIKRKNPLKADRTHIHHIILDLGFSSTQTTLIIIGFAISIFSCALYIRNIRSMDLVLILVGFYALSCSAIFVAKDLKAKTLRRSNHHE